MKSVTIVTSLSPSKLWGWDEEEKEAKSFDRCAVTEVLFAGFACEGVDVRFVPVAGTTAFAENEALAQGKEPIDLVVIDLDFRKNKDFVGGLLYGGLGAAKYRQTQVVAFSENQTLRFLDHYNKKPFILYPHRPSFYFGQEGLSAEPVTGWIFFQKVFSLWMRLHQCQVAKGFVQKPEGPKPLRDYRSFSLFLKKDNLVACIKKNERHGLS